LAIQDIGTPFIIGPAALSWSFFDSGFRLTKRLTSSSNSFFRRSGFEKEVMINRFLA
jgi:hypothetical protein